MIEITERQLAELSQPQTEPLRVVNPQTQEEFVILRAEDYERLRESVYDDSPWTREELEALAWQTRTQLGWDDADDYEHVPERT